MAHGAIRRLLLTALLPVAVVMHASAMLCQRRQACVGAVSELELTVARVAALSLRLRRLPCARARVDLRRLLDHEAILHQLPDVLPYATWGMASVSVPNPGEGVGCSFDHVRTACQGLLERQQLTYRPKLRQMGDGGKGSTGRGV